MLLLWLVGSIGMVLALAFVLMGFMAPPDKLKGDNATRVEVLEAIGTEAVRSTLSPWWKGAPWPDGVVMARIKSRLPEVNVLMLHSLISAITFSLLGFMAGRLFLVNSALLLPPLLSFVTVGFLQSDFFPVENLDFTSVAVVLIIQFACLYGFALWGKWSIRG